MKIINKLSLIFFAFIVLGCSSDGVINENEFSTDSLQNNGINVEWSERINPVNNTYLKIICKEDTYEIYQKILTYLNLKRIFLSDIELERAVVLTTEESSFIVLKKDISIDFNFKDKEVIISGSKINPLNLEWESITPIDSNWDLLSDFSNQLEIDRILYK